MAGHSKWHNIKHRKAAVDAKRGKLWTKCAKAIMVAAKNGGADPETNLTLRYAIDEARYCNMPRDTIERNIKKGAGEIGGEDWETVRYEGYGPNGVAIVVDALTNNRTRTATEVRNAFAKYGGNLGATGCVGFMFQTRGSITLSTTGLSEDDVMEIVLAAGAEDVKALGSDDEGAATWLVYAAPVGFQAARASIEEALKSRYGCSIVDARIDQIPTTTAPVSGDNARLVLKLIETLDDNDDVQNVYSNYDIPESEMAELQG
ncbi:MAG: YebC/PmpR family DNA-binding transcriptional regulator [Phycisphaeraceae bacterium]|nr:YebC/PmpR family DNA-binding transcriptional regulator [Phycisphaeraceae bacterium]